MPISVLFDTHAHLSHPSLQEDIDPLVERAFQSGVRTVVNICTNPEEVEIGILLAQKYPWIYLAAATTPHDVAGEGETFWKAMEDYARSGKLIAVGETGLDYHYYRETQEVQKDFLRRYLKLAKECHLPVIIHCREAFEDLFQILDEEYQGLPGVLHCFTGTAKEAEEVLARGWYLSFSGITTFKKSTDLQEIAKKIPLDRVLIETDSPYLAPLSYRGKQNEPAYLVDTAKCIAALRGLSLEEFAAATRQNACLFFNLLP